MIILSELYARRKLEMPDTWKVFRWQRKGDFIVVTGAVCCSTFKKGPRAGRPKWSSRDRETELTVSIRSKEMRDFELAWSAETGFCHHCTWTGKRFKSWNHLTGATYGECPECAGTGKAKKEAA